MVVQVSRGTAGFTLLGIEQCSGTAAAGWQRTAGVQNQFSRRRFKTTRKQEGGAGAHCCQSR